MIFKFINKEKVLKSNPDFTYSEVKTIIGKGDCFKGTLNSDNFIRIEGDYIGNIISTKRIIVGKEGRVKSNIDVDELVVSGIIVGNIHAKSRVKVFATGCILGNIVAEILEIEEGAIIDGYMNIGTGNLGFYDKDMSLYTGSYSICESIFKEVNLSLMEQKIDKQNTIKSNDIKYLYDFINNDEDK